MILYTMINRNYIIGNIFAKVTFRAALLVTKPSFDVFAFPHARGQRLMDRYDLIDQPPMVVPVVKVNLGIEKYWGLEIRIFVI
jgi:hypothetical protein